MKELVFVSLRSTPKAVKNIIYLTSEKTYTLLLTKPLNGLSIIKPSVCLISNQTAICLAEPSLCSEEKNIPSSISEITNPHIAPFKLMVLL